MKVVVALLATVAAGAAAAADCDCEAMQSELVQLRFKDKALPIAAIIGGCQAIRGVTEATIGAAYGAVAPVIDPIWAEASAGAGVALEQAQSAKAAGLTMLTEALAPLSKLQEENPQLQPVIDAFNTGCAKWTAGVAGARTQGRAAVAGLAPALADHAAIVTDAALGMLAALTVAFVLAAVVKPLLGAVLGLCCDCSSPGRTVSKKMKNRMKSEQGAKKAEEEKQRLAENRKREQDQAKAAEAAKKRANAEAARR